MPINQAHATTVVTTLPPLAGLVHWLDPQAEVITLLPANADPHHFQLTPHQVETLNTATLFIRSSRDDGQWPLLNTHATLFDVWPRESDAHHHEDNHESDHEHLKGNHAWLNPQAVKTILPDLSTQLIRIYPAHAEAIRSQLSQANHQIDTLWQAWQDVAAQQQLKQHGVMMQHPAWQGLFEALHIPVLAVLESEQHGQEHGPHKLENALIQLQEHPKALLIADASHSNRTLDWLQRHHSASIILTLDALGTSDETWPELLQRNLHSLQGLTPQP